MDFRIRDATGRNFGAEVDEQNRLHTLAISRGEMGDRSVNDGSVISIDTGIMNVPLGGAFLGSSLLWIQNTDTANRNFNLNRIVVSWDGGSTNFNRTCIGTMMMGTPVPTANYTPWGGGSLNLAYGGIAPGLLVYKWDGVGTGMTHASIGQPLAGVIFAQGMTIAPYDGALVIPYGTVISFSNMPAEQGLSAVMLLGWFE